MAAKKETVMGREVPAVSCEVKYLGFVYVDGGSVGTIPGLDKVKDAHSLLKRPKKAKKTHPLFARGFDTTLTLRCSEQGLKVFVETENGSSVVMDHVIHKIAFVCSQGKSVLFVAKRRIDSTVDQFKCHGFDTSSQKTAKQLAAHIVSTCNSVFRKLRRTRKQLRKRTEKEGKAAPATETKSEPSSAEAERLKAELQKEVEMARAYRQSLQVALSSLDDEEDDEEEMLKEMDAAMQINYDEFADEFAKISLEMANMAAQDAQLNQRALLLTLTEEGDEIEVADGLELDSTVCDVDLNSDEYMISRSASI